MGVETLIAVAALAAGGFAAEKIMGAKAPKVNAAAAQGTLDDSQLKAQQARSALLETAGGQAGAPLQPGQVSNTRQTLLGN